MLSKRLFALALASLAATAAAATTPAPRTAAMPAGLRLALSHEIASHDELAHPAGSAAWIEQKVLADDGIAGDAFGYAVAIDGDTAFVSAAQGTSAGTGVDNGGAGAVYVFVRSGADWTLTQKLTASDGADDDEFGTAVALSGSTAVVGAAFAGVGDNAHQGAAYVFSKTDGTWTETQKLVAGDGSAGDQFGWSVALDGAEILVGAPGATIGANPSQGAAYVFAGDGGSWTERAKLASDDGLSGDDLGFAVAIRGGTAIATAPNATVGGTQYQGAAYVFNAIGDAWLQGARLVADDGAGTDNLGYSVAFDGTTALIGAPFAAVGANLYQGAVYAFGTGSGEWAQTQKLVVADGLAFDVFGISIGLSGANAVITAPFYNASQGEAFLFSNAGGEGWTEQHTFYASDAEPGAGEAFGFSAALSGGTAVIGSVLADIGGNENQGSAYFYTADRIFANGFDASL